MTGNYIFALVARDGVYLREDRARVWLAGGDSIKKVYGMPRSLCALLKGTVWHL